MGCVAERMPARRLLLKWERARILAGSWSCSFRRPSLTLAEAGNSIEHMKDDDRAASASEGPELEELRLRSPLTVTVQTPPK
jgi:hypothetical protein